MLFIYSIILKYLILKTKVYLCLVNPSFRINKLVLQRKKKKPNQFLNKKMLIEFENEYFSALDILTRIYKILTFNVKVDHNLFYWISIFFVIFTQFAVPVRDVIISKQPNNNKYDEKTDNITLTCTANGNPKPQYIWFKENNSNNVISRTNHYVIDDVIRNNSGIYICESYNNINNVNFTHSNSVKINIGELSKICRIVFV